MALAAPGLTIPGATSRLAIGSERATQKLANAAGRPTLCGARQAVHARTKTHPPGGSMRRVFQVASVVAVFALVGCYHAVIETGRPAGGTEVYKPWAMSFVFGLVPPPIENVASACPNGVSKVETQHSFLNGLVAVVTFQIVTPMEIRVTCAGGGRDNDASLATVRVDGNPRAALLQAIELSKATGRAVYAQF